MKSIKENLFYLCFGISLGLNAQENDGAPVTGTIDIITDRPDATESATTVPLGSLQIETGAFYTSFEENNIKQEVLGYNTTLVRYGILNNLELRLGWNFEEGRTTINGTKVDNVTSGFSPLLTGIKINVVEEKGWIPTIGFLGHLILPITAASDYRPETTGVNFIFSFSHTLSEKSNVGYNLGIQWSDDSPEAQYFYTLVYVYSFLDNFGLYVEVYGDLPENSKANHFWDSGLTYLIMNNLQLDATVGTGITKGQDLLLSAGVSYRIPE
jgi:Putative MetA-pathway of phenol degradation